MYGYSNMLLAISNNVCAEDVRRLSIPLTCGPVSLCPHERPQTCHDSHNSRSNRPLLLHLGSGPQTNTSDAECVSCWTLGFNAPPGSRPFTESFSPSDPCLPSNVRTCACVTEAPAKSCLTRKPWWTPQERGMHSSGAWCMRSRRGSAVHACCSWRPWLRHASAPDWAPGPASLTGMLCLRICCLSRGTTRLGKGNRQAFRIDKRASEGSSTDTGCFVLSVTDGAGVHDRNI